MAERLRGARHTRVEWLEASAGVRTRIDALLASSAAARHDRVEVDVRVLGDDASASDGEVADWSWPDDREPLPAVVRERLRPRVGEAAEAMRIHRGERAHRVAEAHRADAVASGSDVYFRRGRYRPHDDEGFALIAHEATHVSQSLRPNAGWRRPLLAEVAAEEAVATAVERSIRRPSEEPWAAPAAVAAPARTAERPAVAPPTPTARPMTAAADRPLDMVAPAPLLDMERLRQSLARDLMRQIRAELERGG
jgi:hypothetical protein